MSARAPHRTQVLLSYSHKDAKWLERLRIHLKPLERDHGILIWDDTRIAPGSNWRQEIKEALATARVAVLLVSADFLASDFIATDELPTLLLAARTEVTVLPVILSPSRFSRTAGLAEFQAVNNPNRPLISLATNEQEAVLVQVSEAIEAAFAGPLARRATDEFVSARDEMWQLRAPVSDFVGRDEELDRIVAAFDQSGAANGRRSIVVVRGMGGVGKTELVYKVATRLKTQFPGGQLLLELHGESATSPTSEQLLRSVIPTLDKGVKVSEKDTPAELQAKYQAILSDARVLILADNAKSADQVRPLVPPIDCGSVLLITTRHRFALPAMAAVDLDTLPTEAAEQLLRRIDARIDNAAPRLAQLCGRLPLALRVSASVLASDDTLRVERFLERLADERNRLRLLHDPEDPSLDVEASLRLSYDALEPVAQDVLCQLAAFPASFDLRAALATALSTGTTALEELLSILRRRSLVEWQEEEQRYRLHDLVRVFAAAQAADFDGARRRHARFFVHLLTSVKAIMDTAESQEGDNYVSGPDPFIMFWDICEAEAANIKTGWHWAQEHAGDLEADAFLLSYARLAMDNLDALPVAPELIDASLVVLRRQGGPEEEMALLGQIGQYFLITSTDRALEYFERARKIASELHDRVTEGGFLIRIGMAYWQQENAQREIECYEQALQIGRTADARLLVANALINMGNVNSGIQDRLLYEPNNEAYSITTDVSSSMPDGQKAIDCYAEALHAWRDEDRAEAEAATAGYMGHVYQRTDDQRKALEYYDRAHAIMLRTAKDIPQRYRILLGLATAYDALENLSKAEQYGKELLETARRRGQQSVEWTALDLLADGARRRDDESAALAYTEQALAIARDGGDKEAEAISLETLGDICVRLDQMEQALSYFEQALAIARELDDRQSVARLWSALGAVYSDTRRYGDALTAYQASLAMDSTSGQARSTYIGLASVYAAQGRWDEARQAYLQLTELDPTASFAYVGIGTTYERQERYDEAAAAYRKALALSSDPSEQVEALQSLGDLLFVAGRNDEALDTYRRASDLEPRFGIQLGQVYSAIGRVEDALREYEQVFTAAPADVDALLGLARLHRHLDDHAALLKYLELARPLISDDDHYHQACLAAINSDAGEAVKRVEQALASGDVDSAWVRCDPDFEFVRSDPRFRALVEPVRGEFQ